VKGTPEQLTKCLIDANTSTLFKDPDYITDFLMTYRTFTDNRTLAAALLTSSAVWIAYPSHCARFPCTDQQLLAF
jgi:hypothetical protein